ncbi:hypothetical protein KEM54_003968 [Ascosphaera aggregata]|nr:hypothetical protein KEM54_003968 [Ascosphaera aggregata]
MKFIASFLDLDNVSVNYSTAVSPYLNFIEDMAQIVPPFEFPTINLGSWRLGIAATTMPRAIDTEESQQGTVRGPENVLRLYLLTNVVNTIAGDYGHNGRASGFCLSPISTTAIPRTIKLDERSDVEKYLSNVLSNEDLISLMWNIGNGLVDPVLDPRIIYLFGAGGEGKSTTIGMLHDVLRGAIGSFSRDYIGSKKEMTDEDKINTMSNRFMVFGDTVIKDSEINESFWKMVTGKDVITVRGTVGTMRAVCLFAGNNLWYGGSAKHRKWFVRRTLVFKLNPLPEGATPPPETFSDFQRSKFIARCTYLRVYSKSPYIPISSVLLTIFGYRAAVATRGIEICKDASPLECIAGTYAIVIASHIKYDLLVDLVESVSKGLVGEDLAGGKYIRGIRASFNGLG